MKTCSSCYTTQYTSTTAEKVTEADHSDSVQGRGKRKRMDSEKVTKNTEIHTLKQEEASKAKKLKATAAVKKSLKKTTVQ